MAKFIDGQRYDEDDYPIDAWGVRTGPKRGGEAAPIPPPGGGGGGGGGVPNAPPSVGGGGMEMPQPGTMFNVGMPSQSNPYLGQRNPAIEGLTLAMQKPRNY